MEDSKRIKKWSGGSKELSFSLGGASLRSLGETMFHVTQKHTSHLTCAVLQMVSKAALVPCRTELGRIQEAAALRNNAGASAPQGSHRWSQGSHYHMQCCQELPSASCASFLKPSCFPLNPTIRIASIFPFPHGESDFSKVTLIITHKPRIPMAIT